ncbi:hypothetical protein V6N11_063137 [Hibiscus sabdariffa]|uniref:non-specific serine/threonine protein kinase n=1 Tax=Hibiscus sabdariffa TaxID=183260 RepID=A0ABR2ADJ6_9ROSI
MDHASDGSVRRGEGWVLVAPRNNLEESIPFSLSYITALHSLDLSQNSLIGDIPRQLGKLQHLEILDLSHNMLKGTIKAYVVTPCVPSSRANNGLRNNTKLIILVVVPLFEGVLLLFILVASCFSPCRKSPTRKSELREGGQHGNVFSVLEFNGGILHDIIIEATADFSSEYCIGSGGYGTVYKAALPTGQVVAVKKLHQSEDNMLISNSKDFRSEIVALSETRHRNIVQMYGFCSHPKHSFLVYEFVERGSLKMVLSNNEQAKELDWKKRLNVVKGLADALSYMHHDHSQPIVHRDISSNNVLLDLDYEARVSDFSTARILSPDSSH